jgi:peptidoglycan-associated lipoprotein
MKFSMILLGSAAALALGACSHGNDLVVDGPNPPPYKPLYEPFVPDTIAMDDFILASGSNTVLFDTDSSHLDSMARETLDRQAAWLMTHPDVPAIVEGHADKRATDEYNLKLGRSRASSVVDYFVSKGLTRSRFTFRSFGEGKPIVNRPGDVQLNRRAVTVVLDGGDGESDRMQNNH